MPVAHVTSRLFRCPALTYWLPDGMLLVKAAVAYASCSGKQERIGIVTADSERAGRSTNSPVAEARRRAGLLSPLRSGGCCCGRRTTTIIPLLAMCCFTRYRSRCARVPASAAPMWSPVCHRTGQRLISNSLKRSPKQQQQVSGVLRQGRISAPPAAELEFNDAAPQALRGKGLGLNRQRSARDRRLAHGLLGTRRAPAA